MPPASMQVLERLGHEAVPPVAAVVGAGDHLARPAQLVLEDDPLLRPAADHARDLHAALRESHGDRVDDRRPDAAPDAHGVTGFDELGLAAQRPRDVLDPFTDGKADEILGALAHGLDDQGDRAPLPVRVGDRERDPLGAGPAVDDDELAGATDLGDPRRFDDKAGHVGRQLGLVDDGVHGNSRAGGGLSRMVYGRARATHAPARICWRGRMAPSDRSREIHRRRASGGQPAAGTVSAAGLLPFGQYSSFFTWNSGKPRSMRTRSTLRIISGLPQM